MLKNLALTVFLLVGLIILSPILIYWWGLSNLESSPVPSSMILNADQEKKMWLLLKESGEPKVKPISPYGYIWSIDCEVNSGLNSKICSERYPGVKIAAQSIRKQVREKLGTHPNNLKWQFTWIAYTIWITNNWNTKQIISTYYEAYMN